MTKTGGRDKNIDFRQNLTKFTNEKWHFWRQNLLKPTYYNKRSISDGEKLAKFKMCRKILMTFTLFF